MKEKRMSVMNLLIILMSNIGMDTPANIEEITDFVLDDINETADPVEWHSGDVAIGFRRWIEAQVNENVRTPMSEPTGMKDPKGKQITLGSTLRTVKELRYLMAGLNDQDQICVETCDEDGDVEDLFPMSLDVIEGIELTDGTTVREVRFCQRPNAEPDTRDKTELIDAVIKQLMDDYYHGDETCWVELLEHIPYETLKQSLPEEMRKEFNVPTPEEIKVFKAEWGQVDDEINSNLELEDDSTDYLVDDYFWIETEKKWYPKSSLMYTKREQEIADFLR